MRVKKYFYVSVLIKKNLFFLLSVGWLSVLGQQKEQKLWYKQPAKIWEESLVLGNGRLGLSPDGGVGQEQIVLNDITLWSGSKQDANNYKAHKFLPEIRRLIAEGKNDEAQELVNKQFICLGPGSEGGQFGKFQTLGVLNMDFDLHENVKNYKRELSLNTAIANTSYSVNGVKYKREYFTSFDDDIAIIRITADSPGKINCRLTLNRPERYNTYVRDEQLIMSGQLDNGIDGRGMKYFTSVAVKNNGGTVKPENKALVVSNADELIVYISAATDYINTDHVALATQIFQQAQHKSYSTQRANHIRKYQEFYNRLSIDLGKGAAESLSTDERLKRYYHAPDKDPGLPALFFQFGRYLTISSTRVGLLPPNLQGLWAHQVHTPWNGDYHLDVNVQMNHWHVETTNLSELNLPLADLVAGLVENGQKTAQAYYGAKGWIAHVITNIWGYTEPGESASWGSSNAGSGWLCSNLWDHYTFTLDTVYLSKIYPILKGSALFYNDALIKDEKTGWWLTSPSVSPENWFVLPNGKSASITMGPTIDNQIVRELFNNVIEAGKTLNVDEDFRSELERKLQNIPPVGIVSKDGRIQEWIEDYKEADPEHRHISHLYGIFPANQITPNKTPELAEAAKKTLEVRGDDGPSWAIAYKQIFWARLHEGNRAFKLFKEILKPTDRTDINYGAGGGVYNSMLSAGPPFQIDGNFGATTGIAEMLIQSHEGFIDLLPALPDTWKSFGEIKGIKARGNFTVDFSWKNGKVKHYKIYSPYNARKVKVKVNGKIKEIATKNLNKII